MAKTPEGADDTQQRAMLHEVRITQELRVALQPLDLKPTDCATYINAIGQLEIIDMRSDLSDEDKYTISIAIAGARAYHQLSVSEAGQMHEPFCQFHED